MTIIEGSIAANLPRIAFNWFSALAVPVWQPIAAWVLVILGGLLFKLLPRSTSVTH